VSRDFSDSVDAIRQRVNIVDVISRHLTLKKAGKNHRALCPFHHEKTPSFMVSEEKQIFHCFGCGSGGDVFTFLMRHENISFYDALNELAQKAGVTIPRGGHRTAEEGEKTPLFQINQMAADFFHSNLLSKKTGSVARDYLAKRGVQSSIIQDFHLGYAPSGWTNLVDHFREKSVDLRMAQTLGLIVPRKQKGWYDQFRNRVIFPIVNTTGRTVGFGGGAIDDTMPKYLNSAESVIYRKSQSIYGIHKASSEIRRRDLVLVVEGYFDLLTLHQNGIRNALAPLGTALTRDQVRIMRRYSRNFVIIFDSDEAGISATFRALDPFMGEEIHPKTITLPSGDDPDSFVREKGPEALERAVESAVPLVDAFIEHTIRRGDLRTVAGRVEIGRTILPVLRKLRDPLERRLYTNAVSERLGVKTSDLFYSREKELSLKQDRHARLIQPRPSPLLPSHEETLVKVLLKHFDLARSVFERKVIEDFENEELRKTACILKDLFERKGEIRIAEVLDRLSDENLKNLVSSWGISEELEAENVEKAVEDCIRKIKKHRLKHEQDDITQKIREAEKADQTDRLKELLRKKQHLIQEERNLRETHTI
jgi:DNA primase